MEVVEWIGRCSNVSHVVSNTDTSVASARVTSAADHVAEGRLLGGASYRTLDIAIALGGLALTAPLLLLVWCAIRADSSGPAIFRQRRLGRDKRPFTVLKFRTMRAQADSAVHREYIEQLVRGTERSHSDGRRNLYKLVADDRITRVGRLLRRTSIDELPQLYNVLRGQMSIVGPRPVLLYEAELYPDQYARRFEVKPGLTGLWQISGRNQRTYHEMVELDIEWVQRRSLRLYLSIVARTPRALMNSRSAA